VDGCTRSATEERLVAAEHDPTIKRLVPLCAEHAAQLDAEDAETTDGEGDDHDQD
jgi:hypothetical protein